MLRESVWSKFHNSKCIQTFNRLTRITGKVLRGGVLGAGALGLLEKSKSSSPRAASPREKGTGTLETWSHMLYTSCRLSCILHFCRINWSMNSLCSDSTLDKASYSIRYLKHTYRKRIYDQTWVWNSLLLCSGDTLFSSCLQISNTINTLVRPALCWMCCGAQTHSPFTSQAASFFLLWEPEAAAVEPRVVLLPTSTGFLLQLPEGQEDSMVMAVITCCSGDPTRAHTVEYTWNNYHLLQKPALTKGFHRFCMRITKSATAAN